VKTLLYKCEQNVKGGAKMGNLSKKLISIVTAVVVMSGIAFTSLPAIEAKAQTSITTITTATSNTDLDAALKDQVESNSAESYGLTERIKDGAILHAWCWSFKSIKENIKDIAEAGFTAVQTTPANNICTKSTIMKIGNNENNGDKGIWWWQYQPTDWKIGNYIVGSEQDFKELCAEADKYGVKITVDVVPNHTTDHGEYVSQDLANAAGGWDKLYHSEKNHPGWDCDHNRNQCVNTYGDLYDVCTENPGFQAYYLNYLNQLITDGADGFRYDTTKHIGLPDDPVDSVTRNNGWTNNFWSVATGQQSANGVTLKDKDRIFNYGEVLSGTRSDAYSKYLPVTDSAYGDNLRDAINSKSFNADNLKNFRSGAGSNAITWVESHDTYCNNGPSVGLSDWQIKMAWAVIAARKEGTPLFFNRPDGSKNNWNDRWGNNVLGAKGNDLFKDPEVAAVNKFRNAMVGENEYFRNVNGNNQILSIERGKKGQVIINLGGDTSINETTNLNDGTYTDQVSGGTFTVSGGKISGQLKGGKVHVICDVIEKPTVGISPDVRKFKGDSIQVTLKTTNSTSATYSIDGGAETAYTNGQTKPIGENTPVGGTVKITLRAKDDKGNTAEETYTFTKIDGNPKAGVYFNKPSDWGTPTVYIYDDSVKPEKNNGWPGVAMNDNGDGEYYYEIPSDYKNPKVIFAANGKQFPEPQQPGHAYKAGTALTCDGANWTEQEITEPEVIAGEISISAVSPQTGYAPITITTTDATGGTGNITYQIAVNSDTISNSKSATWTPSKAGDYVITVTATDTKGKKATATKNFTIKDDVVIPPIKVLNFYAGQQSPQNIGIPIVLNVNPTGGKGTLQTKFTAFDGNGWNLIKGYSTETSVVWIPTKAGIYQLNATVKDELGKTVTKTLVYQIKEEIPNIEMTLSANLPSPQKAGTGITLITNSTGGKGTLQTKFAVYDGMNWKLIKGFSTEGSTVWTPKAAGVYQIDATVKDASGKMVRKSLIYNVKAGEAITLNGITADKQSVQAGNSVKLTANASSSFGSVLTYKFSVYEGTAGWKSLNSSFTTSKTVNWIPTVAGNYTVMVEVRDALGNKKIQFIDYSVTKSSGTVTNIKIDNSSIKSKGNWIKAGDCKYARAEDASMTFNFSGTGIRINGDMGKNRGVAIVIIDGQLAEVNFYSATAKKGTAFEKLGLTAGTHTISIYSFGIKDTRSSDVVIGMAGFEILNGSIK
jgi:alpha-amylase